MKRDVGAARARALVDEKYVVTFRDKIRELYPGCPAASATRVAEHACQRSSGRVGRTAAAKDLDPESIAMAVRAHVRHEHSEYDRHLMTGLERSEARRLVADDVERLLLAWSSS